MIAERLEKYVLKLEIKSGNPSITGVRFLSGNVSEFSLEYVYLGNASDIFSDSQYADSVILVHGHDLIIIRDEDRDIILNDLLGAFDYYNRWEAALWEVSTADDALQKMVDICKDVIPYPMRIAAVDGKLVASSKNYGPDDVNELWKIMHTTGYISINSGGPIMTNHGLTLPDWSAKPQIYRHPGLKTRYIGANIYTDSEIIATVMIWEQAKLFTPCASQLCDIFCQALTYVAKKQEKSIGIRSKASVLADLLDGLDIDGSSLAQLEKKCGPPFLLVVIRNTAGNMNIQVKKRLLNGVNIDPCTSLIYGENVVVLLSENQIDSLLKNFSDFMNKYYALGISLPFYYLSDLPSRYKQAIFALEKSNGTPGIFYCKDYAFSYLLENVKFHNNALELTHPALDTLQRYDEAQKSQLYKTLYKFILNDRNLVSTSEALFIHRNTLVFRIKRITSIISADLDDPMERSYLLLSYFLRGV